MNIRRSGPTRDVCDRTINISARARANGREREKVRDLRASERKSKLTGFQENNVVHAIIMSGKGGAGGGRGGRIETYTISEVWWSSAFARAHGYQHRIAGEGETDGRVRSARTQLQTERRIRSCGGGGGGG